MLTENIPSRSSYAEQKAKSRQSKCETVIVNGVRRIVPPEVTFRDFAALAKRRGWTPQFLAEEFRGKIEEPSDFFHRVLSCKYKGEDRSGVVIPYRSVLELYHKELSPLIVEGKVRLCECKCGRRVHGRKSYASMACQKRMERRRAETIKSGSQNFNKDGAFSTTF